LLRLFYVSRRSDRRPIKNQFRKGAWLQRSFTLVTLIFSGFTLRPSLPPSLLEPNELIRFSFEKSLVNCETPGHTRNFLQGNEEGKIMIHLIWYIIVGLIAGVIAKSAMHVHMTIFWTIALGIIGSIIGGAVTHIFSHPTNERFHPAGVIFSTLGAILVLYLCLKLHIRFPRVL
jgi:uncharacterized membrane protein YeaQ/YmgE (transglycosylase-associated protein family)